ncbi:hypothetical protein EOD41_12770 [Mucilaginibacter limnophilus]|uniref:Uncharacterized protein n=1 Tax=Mucilaginibacter limnophilus TaxID=1932778 RepID=A0A3S2Y2F6_9SPHI|nr:EboA domain-containing protein [Mucilaginibacter limnophilus]RVU00347.1 hypothetical protein EOD41_12770 [Mucilaginibacter limnophilus]
MNGFGYNIEALNAVLAEVIEGSISPVAWAWFKQVDTNNTTAFYGAFAMMPRKTGKAVIDISAEQKDILNTIRPGFTIDNWATDRLCRVWLLIQPDIDKGKYFRQIENLFTTGEMKELVALYSALPVLPYPELWVKRCAEGIRSNIGLVLEAIMYRNPYPAERLDEGAWNQLIMKALFTDKQMHLITGLDERNNPELVCILIDFAKERWAAGRTVDPALWDIAAKFTEAGLLNEMKQGHWESAGAI